MGPSRHGMERDSPGNLWKGLKPNFHGGNKVRRIPSSHSFCIALDLGDIHVHRKASFFIKDHLL